MTCFQLCVQLKHANVFTVSVSECDLICFKDFWASENGRVCIKIAVIHKQLMLFFC